MKRLLIIFSMLAMANSFSQILIKVDRYLMLVNDSIDKNPISDKRFMDCDCEGYVPNYYWDPDKDIGRVFIPNYYDDGQMILKDTLRMWGSLNAKGEVGFEFKYPGAPKIFPNGFYAIAEGSYEEKRTKIYNKSDELIETYHAILSSHKGNHLVTETNGLTGIVDQNFQVIVPFQYSCTSWDDKNFSFTELGYVSFKNSEKLCGVLDYAGNEVLPFEYDFIEDMHFGQNYAKKDGLYGFLDSTGAVVVPFEYEDIDYEYYNQAVNTVKKGGYWQFVDNELRPISDIKFEDMREYSVERRRPGGGGSRPAILKGAKVDGKWKLFNPDQLDFANQMSFDSLSTVDSLFMGISETSIVFMNEQGEDLSVFEKDQLELTDQNGSKVQIYSDDKSSWYRFYRRAYIKIKDGKKGIVYPTGEMILDCEYDDIIVGYEWFIVSQNGKWGIVDKNGQAIVPLEYQDYCDFKAPTNSSWKIEGFVARFVKGKSVYTFNEKGEQLSVEKLSEECSHSVE